MKEREKDRKKERKTERNKQGCLLLNRSPASRHRHGGALARGVGVVPDKFKTLAARNSPWRIACGSTMRKAHHSFMKPPPP
eukprot:1946829-Amphidinium_carterae.1